jgi:lysozyme
MTRKPVFDTVRELLGRGFRQPKVERIDRAIDAACGALRPAAELKPGSKAFELIKRFEGCASLRPDGLIEAYPDPGTGGAPWTIGWGTTGPDIGPGTVCTQEQCDARLVRDVKRHAAEVAKALGKAATTQAQFDALVSFHYNKGAIARATLTERHRAGDHVAAMEEFARWNCAGGRVLKGLVRRRQAKARLYARG